MRNHQRLNDADREQFAEAAESSFGVVSRPQLFRWTQSAVHALVPHEILICGVEDGSSRGMAIHHFSASRYFGNEQFEAVTHPLTGLMARMTVVAGGARNSIVFSPVSSPTASDDELFALVRSSEMKNLAALLVCGTRGPVEAFYSFSRIAVPLDERVAYILELLIPYLHLAFLRVLATERDLHTSTSQRSGRLLTPRQEQILNLVKTGKTNAEIAAVLDCSPWTIKNHIQAILRKLDSNTRSHAIARAMSLRILQPD
jgi:transcriptional regulator EpsA